MNFYKYFPKKKLKIKKNKIKHVFYIFFISPIFSIDTINAKVVCSFYLVIVRESFPHFTSILQIQKMML